MTFINLTTAYVMWVYMALTGSTSNIQGPPAVMPQNPYPSLAACHADKTTIVNSGQFPPSDYVFVCIEQGKVP
jgi:hypothetical protein